MASTAESSQQAADFSSLLLHDAVLHELRLDWERRTCTAYIDAFVDRGQEAVPRQLVWHDVSDADIPQHQPWGPSSCINEGRLAGAGTYIIQMQSGDEIRIVAKNVMFVTPDRQLEAAQPLRRKVRKLAISEPLPAGHTASNCLPYCWLQATSDQLTAA